MLKGHTKLLNFLFFDWNNILKNGNKDPVQLDYTL